MRGCMKDFLNLLHGNRERVAFSTSFFSKVFLSHGNEAHTKTVTLNAFFIYNINKSLHFTVNSFS